MNYNFSDRISSLKPSAIREILKATSDPSVIPLAAGNPAAEAFPAKEIAEISADILANSPVPALQYSITEGYPAFLEATRGFACRRENLIRDFDAIMAVSGAQQGIELATKCLCNEGDTIICEDPSFIGSLNAFRSYKLNLVGIPLESDGIDPAKLEQALKDNPKTRFIYLIPNFQNPTGITTSAQKRMAIYDIAKKYGVLILEDDPYGALRFEGEHLPSFKSMDSEGIVIHCGSFSKIISPGMRLGYTIAPAEIISKMTVAKQASDVHSGIWAQMVCNKFLREYDIEAHIERIRGIYSKKCALMLSCMDKHFNKAVTYTRPEGGLFVWCKLPDGADMLDFCKKSVERRVALVPGVAFTAQVGAPSQCFRMNYSTPSDEGIIKGVELVGELTQSL